MTTSGGMDTVSDVGDVNGSEALLTSNQTLVTLAQFILVMVLYPDVQRKAQKELDNYLGGRLPCFDDRPHLPYVESTLKETLRWATPVSFGKRAFYVRSVKVSNPFKAPPHRLTKTDEFHGYVFPKGSLVRVSYNYTMDSL